MKNSKDGYKTDVTKYSRKSEMVLKKGELAILDIDYYNGKYDTFRYEIRKSRLEKEIKVLSRNVK